MIKQAHKELLAWYDKDGRHELPWRNTEDIYHIYLSEIMLQQTQVNRVRDEYYPQFLSKFPTLESLAKAPLDDVLAAWSGLGYYSRARNLHKAAQLCQKALPKTLSELLSLPGIGQYTASAVCSFGYGQNVPVVDTNIARVLKSYFALLHVKDKTVLEYAQKFLNNKHPRSHNLALMDLGSQLCLPKNPKCNKCPIQANCQGKEEAELYTQTKKKEYEFMELFYGIYIKNNKVALTPATGNMYKNMLELPTVDPIEENYLGSFKHSYTKYRLHVKLYKMHHTVTETIWITLDELHKTPVSSLTKKAISTILN
jgi:A/G-specific adenine glycosylase